MSSFDLCSSRAGEPPVGEIRGKAYVRAIKLPEAGLRTIEGERVGDIWGEVEGEGALKGRWGMMMDGAGQCLVIWWE